MKKCNSIARRTVCGVFCSYGRQLPQSNQIKSNPMNITHASTKADIIDASCEVIDTQAEQINDLKERQLILWTIVGILTVLLAFGA